jgi:hypothetical protein
LFGTGRLEFLPVGRFFLTPQLQKLIIIACKKGVSNKLKLPRLWVGSCDVYDFFMTFYAFFMHRLLE